MTAKQIQALLMIHGCHLNTCLPVQARQALEGHQCSSTVSECNNIGIISIALSTTSANLHSLLYEAQRKSNFNHVLPPAARSPPPAVQSPISSTLTMPKIYLCLLIVQVPQVLQQHEGAKLQHAVAPAVQILPSPGTLDTQVMHTVKSSRLTTKRHMSGAAKAQPPESGIQRLNKQFEVVQSRLVEPSSGKQQCKPCTMCNVVTARHKSSSNNKQPARRAIRHAGSSTMHAASDTDITPPPMIL